MASEYYLYEHPKHPPRISLPEDAGFTSGDPGWVRCYPVVIEGCGELSPQRYRELQAESRCAFAERRLEDALESLAWLRVWTEAHLEPVLSGRGEVYEKYKRAMKRADFLLERG